MQHSRRLDANCRIFTLEKPSFESVPPLHRLAPSIRKTTTSSSAACLETGCGIVHDVFDYFQRVVGGHVRISGQPFELAIHLSLHARRFRAPVFKSRVFEQQVIHLGWIDSRDIHADVKQPLA